MSQFALGTLIVAVFSYLLGSISFAIIVSRIYAKDDVRDHGSGNAGMTNILRTYGKGPAVFTALGDFCKGLLAVILARVLFGRMNIAFVDAGYIAGLFVILGHLFPVYFGFRGGKGVMTALGIIFIVNPLVFLIIAGIFVPLVFITRIVSLGSVLGAIAFPFVTWGMQVWRGRPALYDSVCAAAIGAIVLIMHRENIKRLLSGTERKFGKK